MEPDVLLNSIDRNLQRHLTEMEKLRRSVGLCGYGQKDRLNECKHETYDFFEALVAQICSDICKRMFRIASSDNASWMMIEQLLLNSSLLGRDQPEDAEADEE